MPSHSNSFNPQRSNIVQCKLFNPVELTLNSSFAWSPFGVNTLGIVTVASLTMLIHLRIVSEQPAILLAIKFIQQLPVSTNVAEKF